MARKSNNLTGMEWTALCLKGKSFLGAIQEYKSQNGDIIPVCFTTSNAFIFKDGQGIYPTEEMKYQVKNQQTGFPEAYDVYEEVLSAGDDTVSSQTNDLLQLCEDDLKDISARLEALAPYAEEIAVNLGDM
jgi:hypothetical protein